MQQSSGALSREYILALAERDSGAYGLADDALKTRVGALIDWINERGPYAPGRRDAPAGVAPARQPAADRR